MAELLAAAMLLGLIAVVVTVIVVVAQHQKRQQQRSDELSFLRWQRLNALSATSPGAELALVTEVYQRARRGAKAVIVWRATGIEQDSWFHGMNPMPGDLLLLRGSSGWGPHNSNPNVFYVMPGQVLAALPWAAQQAAARHQHRLATTGAS